MFSTPTFQVTYRKNIFMLKNLFSGKKTDIHSDIIMLNGGSLASRKASQFLYGSGVEQSLAPPHIGGERVQISRHPRS